MHENIGRIVGVLDARGGIHAHIFDFAQSNGRAVCLYRPGNVKAISAGSILACGIGVAGDAVGSIAVNIRITEGILAGIVLVLDQGYSVIGNRIVAVAPGCFVYCCMTFKGSPNSAATCRSSSGFLPRSFSFITVNFTAKII